MIMVHLRPEDGSALLASETGAARSVKHEETMWAEMKPDVYGGKTCDRVVPGWSIYADGDRVGEDNVPDLGLRARHFPPGTKVVVSEPVCPNCTERRSPKFPIPKHGPLYGGPCDCGFDWDAWVLDQYS